MPWTTCFFIAFCVASEHSCLCSKALRFETLYFVTEEASRRLAAVGFQKRSERQEWKLKPGGRYYFTRNLSTIVAFAVGAKYQPGNGLHMIGAHTDRSAFADFLCAGNTSTLHHSM